MEYRTDCYFRGKGPRGLSSITINKLFFSTVSTFMI
jgi:hypothetical protein